MRARAECGRATVGRFVYFSDRTATPGPTCRSFRRLSTDAGGGTDQTDPESVRELIASVPPPVLNPYRVSKAVNNVRNKRPELLAPVRS
jgi:hypothetical protein